MIYFNQHPRVVAIASPSLLWDCDNNNPLGEKRGGERGANALGYLFLVTSPPTGGVPGCAWNDGSYTFSNARVCECNVCIYARTMRCPCKFLNKHRRSINFYVAFKKKCILERITCEEGKKSIRIINFFSRFFFPP